MNDKELHTIAQVKKAIKKADQICIQPRFGVSEKWIRITKEQARILIEGFDDDATPQQSEMFTGRFGELADEGRLGKTLYLG